MAFITKTRVRYQETDQMGVVYHSNYLVYFEIGRTELMRAAGVPYAELEKRGSLLAVTRAELNYHASARYDDVLRIETVLDRVGKARIALAYEVFEDETGRLLASGRTELACLEKGGGPRRLDREVVARLEQALAT